MSASGLISDKSTLILGHSSDVVIPSIPLPVPISMADLETVSLFNIFIALIISSDSGRGIRVAGVTLNFRP